MIRVYITKWTQVGNHIQNPIMEAMNDVVMGKVIARAYYPDADMNGVPDSPYMITFLISDEATQSQLEQFDALPDAWLIPPQRIDASINSARKAAIQNRLNLLGISFDISGYSTPKDIIENLIKTWKPDFIWPQTNPGDYA